METTKSKEKYRYYVILSGGKEFKIDFETYNVCKAIIQGDSNKIQNLIFEADNKLDFTSKIIIKTKDIIAVIKHTEGEKTK